MREKENRRKARNVKNSSEIFIGVRIAIEIVDSRERDPKFDNPK
jgi:hypothetical protein